jgi:hypothetical protein
MNHQKIYAGFAKDESSSMGSLRSAAVTDYNNTIGSLTGASSREVLDTIVSVVGFGSFVTRQIVNSNPHVLQPLTGWTANGNTALYDGIGDLIEQFLAVPDYNNQNVSFIVSATTDGEENCSHKYNKASLRRKIEELQATGRWTFVLRVPKGARRYVDGLGIPAGNIQEWETTSAGMAQATAATTQAFDSFITARASGQKSSTVFYANATAVDTSKLVDISKRTSLYVVESYENGKQIRDFILARRSRYLKGSAFYQLTKTEPRVGPNKMLAVRDRTTGVVYAGKEARTMLGLSSVDNIRLHPGDHGNYDLFIQSESVNRKLVAGTGVLYWEEIGVPFTQEEIDRFTGVTPAPAKPAVVVLPAVAPTNRPTPSPLKPTPVAKPTWPVNMAPAPQVPAVGGNKPTALPAVNGRVRYHAPTADALFYSTRDIAREVAQTLPGKKQYDAGPTAPYGRRFFVAAA